MLIDLIDKKYNGNIRMLPPLKECDVDLPEQLKSILTNANGIKETMAHPKTGELIAYYEKHEYRNRETMKMYNMD